VFHHKFWALRNISFSIKKGTTVGVLGQNGSGKSTLLKILAGLMLPTEGHLTVNGKKSALIELGMGFHPLGISREEIDAKFNQMVDFSGIGDFIDRPVKTYSSGMYVRLAFSVAISIDPEILLIDEVLAVGDALFSQKCMRKLKEFQEQGVTIFFVSHDMSAIKNLCDEAMLLDQGRLIERGNPEEVSEYYTALIQKRYAEEVEEFTIIRKNEEEKLGKRHRYGNFDAAITKIKIINASGEEVGAVVSGEECIILLKAIFFEDVKNAVVGILIRDRLGNEVFGTNTGHYNQNTGPITKDEILSVNFRLRMNIGPGDYSITAAVHSDEYGFGGHYDWIDKAIAIRVLPSEPRFIGLSKLEPQIAMQRTNITDSSTIVNPLNMIFPDAPNHIEMGEEFQKFLIKGWHQSENWKGDKVRWTKKEPVFIMKISGKKIKLEIESLKPNIEREPISGELFCNGTSIGSFTLKEHGWRNLVFGLKDNLVDQVARFKFIMNNTWCPDDFFRSGDKRELGVCVRRIWCE